MSASRLRRSSHDSSSTDRSFSHIDGHAEPDERSALLSSRPGQTISTYYNHSNIVMRSSARSIGGLYGILCSSPVHWLLLAQPVVLIAKVFRWPSTVQFFLCLAALAPLQSIINTVLEIISPRLGATTRTIAIYLSAITIDLILGAQLLLNTRASLVQSFLLGCLIYNILFIPGCSFVAGGIRFKEQRLSESVNNLLHTSLFFPTAIMLAPTVTLFAQGGTHFDSSRVDFISRATAILLLVLCVFCFLFQNLTHTELFEGEEEVYEAEDEDEAVAKLYLPIVLLLTALVIAVAVFVTGILTVNIYAVASVIHCSHDFVAMFMLPIAVKIQGLYLCVIIAWKNELDIVLGLCVGGAMQYPLFLVPVLVLLGWIAGLDLRLDFGFAASVLVLLSMVISGTSLRQRSNYLYGVMCLGLFTVIAIIIALLPGDANII